MTRELVRAREAVEVWGRFAANRATRFARKTVWGVAPSPSKRGARLSWIGKACIRQYFDGKMSSCMYVGATTECRADFEGIIFLARRLGGSAVKEVV